MTRAEQDQKAKSLRKEYQTNPTQYFEKVLGIETLEDYQARVIQTVADNDRVAISACHDVGKSFLMARIAIWFLTMYKNSKVITTAPTFNQVERILWSEIRAAYGKAKIPLGGKLNLTDWSMSPEWFALGFSPKNEVTGGEGQGTQSSFQGFHAAHLLLIFDEATGINPNIWTMAEGLLTSAHVKFVAIGNPTSKNSDFYQCFRSPSWTKVYLSCFDSPNLIANGITNQDKLESEIEKVKSMNDSAAKKYLDGYKVTRPYLLTAKWTVQQALKWGIDHPLTVSKILGKFPEAGDNTLIPLGFVESAQLREVTPLQGQRKTIGVDVGRFGPDSSVLTGLDGLQQKSRKELFQKDEIEVVGEVINQSRQMGGVDIIVVDETGVGGGVVTLLKDAVRTGALPKTCEVRGVQFGAGVDCNTPYDSKCKDNKHISCDKAKYVNMKARMFGLLADDMKRKDGLKLLNESIYLEELPSIVKKFDQKGRMFIESKDEYKKRTGRGSPDSADSLALANFGRYDELNVGTFAKNYNTEARPYSSGLRSEKNW
jgi:phage terminase large subunit